MSSTSNIQGIISNLDTSSIIEAIMSYESKNVDLLQARQDEKTKELTVWQSINTMLLAFKTQADILSKGASWKAFALDVSDDTVISATSTGDTALGTYYLKVLALAQNHQLATQGFSSATATIGTGTVTIQVGNQTPTTITLDSNNNTLAGLKDVINSANLGVTATIVNDGSNSNSYRLILSSNKVGTDSAISISTSLTGGTAPDFVNSSFDSPEKLAWNNKATANISLGETASYSGSVNKTYTFTVGGSGVQTIGSADIILNWTDGTNSGSVVVSQANQEVVLVGTGSDGLKLSFTSGDLVAGDTFQISTFAPVLQKAKDAQVAFGSSGEGSPLVVTSHTNTIMDLIPGVTLNLKKSSSTDIVITTSVDTASLKGKVKEFVNKYNSLMNFIDGQFSYNSETGEAGILLGDSYLMSLQANLRSKLSNSIPGLTSGYNILAAIGIKTSIDGKLSIDDTKLDKALTEHLSEVIDLFKAGGKSDNNLIKFLSCPKGTKSSQTGYAVDITQAATKGTYQGTSINNPAVTNLIINESNDSFKIVVDGTTSGTIQLTHKTYTSGEDLAEELENKINADTTLGNKKVKIEWVPQGATGYLKITSNAYGSTSNVNTLLVSNSALESLGLSAGNSVTGLDVKGTINGEPATGKGQILTGNSGNKYTDGLSLLVTLDSSQFVTGNEATITISKGVASLTSELLGSLTDTTNGLVTKKASSLQKQIEDIKSQIKKLQERLAIRKENLTLQFSALEETLSRFQSQSTFLQNQLSYFSNNLQNTTTNSQ
jgi:flagellar hook-associated protein 2